MRKSTSGNLGSRMKRLTKYTGKITINVNNPNDQLKRPAGKPEYKSVKAKCNEYTEILRRMMPCNERIFAETSLRLNPIILLMNTNNAIGTVKNNSGSIPFFLFKSTNKEPPCAIKINKAINRLIFSSLFSGV